MKADTNPEIIGQARTRKRHGGEKTRHSYVRFFPSDWLAGTARMSRLHKSVYFDICCYIWDKAAAVPAGELRLMVSDLPDGMQYVHDLIDAGKLFRCEGTGEVCNVRALAEAKSSRDLWEKKSRGGTLGASKTNAGKSGDGSPVASGHAYPEPYPEPEPEESLSVLRTSPADAGSGADEQEGDGVLPNGEPGQGQDSLGGEDGNADEAEGFRSVVNAYNAAAKAAGLPEARWPLAKSRQQLVRQRIKEYGVDAVVAELLAVPTKRRFLGDNPETQWRCDFGQLMRASTFAALLEGRYDRAKPGGNGAQSGAPRERNAIQRILAGRLGDSGAGDDAGRGSLERSGQHAEQSAAPAALGYVCRDVRGGTDPGESSGD
jgi:hypothetical protein